MPAQAVRVLKQDLADRALAELPDVIDRELRMHERVFGPDSVALIQEHFAKVDRFRDGTSVTGAPPAVPAPVPAAPAAWRTAQRRA